MVKAVSGKTWLVAALSNFSLDIHTKIDIHNLPKSADIGQNSDKGIFDFHISGQTPCKQKIVIVNNNIRLGTVTKFDKENTTMSKRLPVMLCYKIMNSFSFFQFMTNLEQSKSQIPDAWPIVLKYSLITIFCLTKSENRTKICFTKLSQNCFWVKVLFSPKKCWYFAKKVLTSAILKGFRFQWHQFKWTP